PLPGEKVPQPGMAYWFPPLSPSIYSGPRAAEVAASLRKGGLPARKVADVSRAAAYPSALLMMLVAAVEESNWSFDRLLHGEGLDTALGSFREVSAMIERKI